MSEDAFKKMIAKLDIVLKRGECEPVEDDALGLAIDFLKGCDNMDRAEFFQAFEKDPRFLRVLRDRL